jgi:hypothetical protein
MKKKEAIYPLKILQRLVEYMPDEYTEQRQFINCKEYLNQNELGLALDSLIEMTSETKHYFSDEFWLEIIKAAKEMDMKSAIKYSEKQLKRNTLDLSSSSPFGWSSLKLDENHFQTFISKKLTNKWDDERRKKDEVLKDITKDGLYHKPHGRSGYIYYVRNRKLAEVNYELGSEGLIIWIDSVTGWILPEQNNFGIGEKDELKNAITEWSKETNNPIEFD